MESRASLKEEKQCQKTNGTAREHSWDKQKPDHEILKLFFLMCCSQSELRQTLII